MDGGVGNDTLKGGTGSDTYYVDNTSDVIEEGFNLAAGIAVGGKDTVIASYDYTLADGGTVALTKLENLTLAGGATNGTGNILANVLKANSIASTLTGNAGNDTLIGGAGNDTLIGGAGDDTYNVGAGDVVTEVTGLGSGVDTVSASATYVLDDNVERLILVAGTTDIDGTGNSSNNTITGNSGANSLDGGAGNDTMVGGAGDDIYVVDNAGDVVTEVGNAGTDTIQSSVNFSLATTANVEKLVLTGSAAITATGSASADSLTGNLGANTIDGGAGADTMTGGEGNDIYVVDDAFDVINETSTSVTQIDTVQASVSYTLGATNLENLTLTGAAVAGTGNDRNNILTGNALNNSLTGGAGNDTLDGGVGDDTMIGGIGNDIMIGGIGSDTYYLDNAGDQITEVVNVVSGVYTGGKDTVIASINYIRYMVVLALIR